MSFVDIIRKLVKGKSWPRTRYISKTLNPDWGDAKMSFVVEDCFVGQMLFIAAIDYDTFSQDDFLGSVALNVEELIAGEESSNVINKALLSGGREVGRIELTISVARVVQSRRMTTLFRSSIKNVNEVINKVVEEHEDNDFFENSSVFSA